MKRLFITICILAAMFTTAQAEWHASFYHDLDHDGNQESFSVHREPMSTDEDEGMLQYLLEVRGADDEFWDAIQLDYGYFHWPYTSNLYMRVCALAPNLLYTETIFSWDGTSVTYSLYRWNGEQLVLERQLCDPGYSDGEGLRDELTGTDYYLGENNSSDDWPALEARRMEILNEEFADVGLRFDWQDYALPWNGSWENLEEPLSVTTAVLPKSAQLYCALGYEVPEPVPLSEVPDDAYIRTTGNVNVRCGPNLECPAIGSVEAGTELPDLQETETDRRGVEWYEIVYDGCIGWVSSKYAERG